MSIFEGLLAGHIVIDSPVATGDVLDLTLAVGRRVVFAHQFDTPAKTQRKYKQNFKRVLNFHNFTTT